MLSGAWVVKKRDIQSMQNAKAGCLGYLLRDKI